MSGIKHFVNYFHFWWYTNDKPSLSSRYFVSMMHSLILCLSRADIPPGRSTEVTVTGPIRNIQQGTTAIIQFSTRPYWSSYPAVSRAVYLSVGLPPVSTFTPKKGDFHALLWICLTCIQQFSSKHLPWPHSSTNNMSLPLLFLFFTLYFMRKVRLIILCLLLVPSQTNMGPIHTHEGPTLQH
jgi:hypothetical protein